MSGSVGLKEFTLLLMLLRGRSNFRRREGVERSLPIFYG